MSPLGVRSAAAVHAVIVLRHHDPPTVDRLARPLERHEALPVAPAHDGDRLLAGHVYVAPAGFHTLVTGEDAIALIVSGDRPPYRPSADLRLTILATAAGPRAIAVVLSGHWDLVVVLAFSVVLQTLVLAAGRIGAHAVALRPDLADWLPRQADATGEPPALLVDRAVAAYRAGLIVPTEDRADDRR